MQDPLEQVDMVFNVDQAISIAGKKLTNEDVVGWTVGAAWVIDGATPLGSPYTIGHLSSAAWFAQRISDKFNIISAEDDDAQAGERVVRAQAELAAQMREMGLGDSPYPPSASAAYLFATDAEVKIAVVGDVEVIVADNLGNVEVISNELPDRLVNISQGGIKWGDISNLYEQRRITLNDDGFSHSLSLAPLHSKAMLERTIAAGDISRILMLSDGFAILRELGQNSLLTSIVRGDSNLYEAAHILRSLEGQVKVESSKEESDDATALLLHFIKSD